MINVAIIEDSEVAWQLYDTIFADTDTYTVHKAMKMSELDNIDFYAMDIVLMDGSVDFPDDGYDAAKTLRMNHPDLPIIISSFAPDPKLSAECGANEYWTKGYSDRRGLLPIVNDLLFDKFEDQLKSFRDKL